MKIFVSLIAFGLSVTFAAIPSSTAVAQAQSADTWEIGPTIKGRNYSVGMQPYLDQGRDGPSFAFPGPTRAQGHVHAITMPVGSLEGARRITLRYRIDAAPGTRF